MINEKSIIAVFDLDGTITSKDTYLEFIKFARGKVNYFLGLAVLSPLIIAYYLKILSNSKLKESFFSFHFKGKNSLVIKELGDKFAEYEIPKLTRKGANKVIEWHKRKNNDIIILSASADIWIKKWCDINNFKLICSEFEVENDKFTGKLKGQNCYGKQKRFLLQSYLKNQTLKYSYGYGDNSADKFFLELLDETYLMPLDDNSVKKFWKPQKAF